ncbi:3-ketoacyl-CoA thiolase, partial [Striga asiatica]
MAIQNYEYLSDVSLYRLYWPLNRIKTSGAVEDIMVDIHGGMKGRVGICHLKAPTCRRLECTMQNIADSFTNTYSSRCYKGVTVIESHRKHAAATASRKFKVEIIPVKTN